MNQDLFCFSTRPLAAVDFSQLRLVDLACRVADDRSEDDLSRTLVAGQIATELIEFVFIQFIALLDLDNLSRDFTESFIRQTDDSRVMDFGIGH